MAATGLPTQPTTRLYFLPPRPSPSPAGLAHPRVLSLVLPFAAPAGSLAHSLLSLPMSNGSNLNWIASYTWGSAGHRALRDVYVWANYPPMMVMRGAASTPRVAAGPTLPRASLVTPPLRGSLPCLVYFAPLPQS